MGFFNRKCCHLISIRKEISEYLFFIPSSAWFPNFFFPWLFHALVTETVFMGNVRPGVSRAFCIWYKALGPLMVWRMTRCSLVEPIRGVNQRLCRSAMQVLGIFENLSWISNQEYWLLLILQPVLLHPNQNRRAAPQRCSHPWSSMCCYCGHSQPSTGTEDQDIVTSGILSLSLNMPFFLSHRLQIWSKIRWLEITGVFFPMAQMHYLLKMVSVLDWALRTWSYDRD